MLELLNIRKSFGGLDVLTDVNLTLRPGDRVGLVGGNGSGKSTLINIVTGFLRAQDGAVRLEGRSLDQLEPWRIARLGIRRTFQSVRMQRSAVLGEQLRMGRTGSAPVAEMIRDCGLDPFLHRFPSEIPLPVLGKAEVIRALVASPKILFMDEPSGGLSASELSGLASFLNRWVGPDTALVVVEHRRELMDMTVERTLRLQDGCLRAENGMTGSNA